MIRPRKGIWLLVGGAFNRRSRVDVVDHLVTDPDRFVPLVVEIDTRDITPEPRWLEMELGCVTPLRPAARMRKQRLAAGAPELREFAAFFSDAYFETKAKHPTATMSCANANAPRAARRPTPRAAPACSTSGRTFTGAAVRPLHHAGRIFVNGGVPGTLQSGVVNNIAPTTLDLAGTDAQQLRSAQTPPARAAGDLAEDVR